MGPYRFVSAAFGTAASTLALLACAPRAKVDVEVRSDEIVFRTITLPEAKVSVGARTTQADADGRAELRVPSFELPLGAQSATVTISHDGRTGAQPVAFERPKIPARITIGTATPHEPGLTMRCLGVACAGETLSFGVDGTATLRVTAPPGSEGRIADTSFSASPLRERDVTVNLAPVLLALDVAAYGASAPQKRPEDIVPSPFALRVTSHDRETAELIVGISAPYVPTVVKALAKVREVPFRLGADPAKPEPHPHVVYRPRFERFEGSGTLADVDRVAFERIVERRKIASCGAYVAMVNGQVSGVSGGDVFEIDDIVTVYDRRTGKEVATRTFNGTSECREDFTTPGGPPKQEPAVVAWLLDWK